MAAVVSGVGVLCKLWQKYHCRRLSAVSHVSIGELLAELETDQAPLLLDLRSVSMVAETGPNLGATVADHDRQFEAVGDWLRQRQRLNVTLCHCPEDAGSIQAANR